MRKSRIAIMLVLMAVGFQTLNLMAQDLVDKAWSHWSKNEIDLAEATFKEAAEANPQSIRPYLGLSFLYQQKHDMTMAWNAFARVILLEPNHYPYVYASQIAPRFAMDIEKPRVEIIQLYKRLINQCPEPVLKASVLDKLGRYYYEHGSLDEARSCHEQNHPLTDWMLIGPFENVSGSGYDKSFFPETELNYSKVYQGKNDMPINWFKPSAKRVDNWVDYIRYFAHPNALFYGNTFVYVPEQIDVDVRIGTSGFLKAFLNDELIVACEDENNNDLDTYVIQTTLQAGWNRLLIKCGYSEITQCNFYARITDRMGNPLKKIGHKSDIQEYPSKPGASKTQVPNFAEVYFQKAIEEHPTHLENYLLLADCYLRNDKAVEAELVLLEAQKQAPDNALFHEHLLEAYLRGEKEDDVATTLQKMETLAPDLPDVLLRKLERHLENKMFDKAKIVLDKMDALLPGSYFAWGGWVRYYSALEMRDKLIEAIDDGYKRFPDEWDCVLAKASIAIQTKQNYSEAIKIMNRYLKGHTGNEGFLYLAEYYLKSSQFLEFTKIWNQLMDYFPASPGYPLQLAKIYMQVQQYSQAVDAVERALGICPTAPAYWSTLGEIQRIQNKIPSAKASFQKALLYSPTDFDTRSKLRELEGKKSVYANFSDIDKDSLIAASPGKGAYPDDSAVILLQDINRVVYDDGTTECCQTMLIQLFDDQAIDWFKEYQIEHNQYKEELIVEKVVSIKQDGTEVEADRDESVFVFKSLEEGDFIYLRYKLRNYYSGKLSRHFWEDYDFNMFLPIKVARYSLLLPESMKFQYRTQNIDLEPTTRQTDDGMLYTWRTHDMAAIDGEYGMPPLADVGARLQVTTLPDWAYVVSWYNDIASKKTRSTYEIRNAVAQVLGDGSYTEHEKIERIYQYITENIRYSYMPFRQSGLIPQSARDVLVNKIGDCKDMAGLAIAMLREAGIDAHFVLVNTRDEGHQPDLLPTIDFNHAIAAVSTSSGVQYIDLTAQHYPFGSIPDGDIGAMALPIMSSTTAPVYISDKEYKRGNKIRSSTIAVKDDGSIDVKKQSIRTDGMTAGFRDTYRFASAEDRKKEMKEVLARSFANVILHRFEAENLDNLSDTVTYHYDYSVPSYVTAAGNLQLLKLPWADAVEPDVGLAAEERQYVMFFRSAADTLIEEMRVELPQGLAPVALTPETRLSCKFADYTLTLKMEGSTLLAVRTYVQKDGVVSPEAYKDFKAFYNEVVKADNMQLVFQPKS